MAGRVTRVNGSIPLFWRKMSGWRHFGIEIEGHDGDLMATLLKEKFGEYDKIELMGNSFIHIFLSGYGTPKPDKYGDPKKIYELRVPDFELASILRDTKRKGYYLMMDDTTDTCNGLVRLGRNHKLKRIVDFVDEETDRYTGGNKLPYYQMGSPAWGDVYDFMRYNGLPISRAK